MPLSQWKVSSLLWAGMGIFVLTALTAWALGLKVIPYMERHFLPRRSQEQNDIDPFRVPHAPMGGVILFLGATIIALLLLRALALIRWGYVLCFLMPVLGFGLLGYWDDRRKVHSQGLDDRTKIFCHSALALAFSLAYWFYAAKYLKGVELGKVMLPGGGEWALGTLYIPLLAGYFFLMANAVNFTDGFNGLAGGSVMWVCLGYGALGLTQGSQVASSQPAIADRFYSLSFIALALAGGCLGFLPHNWRGRIIMGDAGSMALGAALVFLAVFSQTEWLLPLMAGAITVDGLSTLIQRGWGILLHLFRPLEWGLRDPWRPFIIAPLHHHLEVLWLREQERTSPASHLPELRLLLRERITLWAWFFTLLTVLLGILAYTQPAFPFWKWGAALIALPLLWGVITRLQRDCYFIGVEQQGALPRVVLYQGLPWQIGPQPLYRPYEWTEIPAASLSYVEQRTIFYRVFTERIDARVIMGALLYRQALRTEPGSQRRILLEQALSFWERVPRLRFLFKNRSPLLFDWAQAARELKRYAQAVEVLRVLPPHWPEGEQAHRLSEEIQEEAWQWAEDLWWQVQPALQGPPGMLGQEAKSRLQEALLAYQELESILRIRWQSVQEHQKRLNQELSQLERSPLPREERLRAIGQREEEWQLLEEEGRTISSAQEAVRRRREQLERALGGTLPSEKRS